MDATVPFRSPIQIALFLPFRNGEKAIFTAETVAQRNGPIVAKQAHRNSVSHVRQTYPQPPVLFLAELQRSDRAATYIIRHKNKNSSYYDYLSRTCLIGLTLLEQRVFSSPAASVGTVPSQ